MKVIAPARVDLAGGTLDVPPLCFLIEKALTLNLAINLEVSVSLKPSSRWQLFPNDNEAPAMTDLPPLFRMTFSHLGMEDPLEIRVSSQIPQASGLGGSSTLLVALVTACLTYLGAETSQRELLNIITVLEHQLLGKPAGTQDAIAAIHGGLSVIDYRSGLPTRKALPVPDFLKGGLLLAYSSVQHHSGMNNWAIIKAACEGEEKTLKVLRSLADNAHALYQTLLANDAGGFLNCLKEEALLRGMLAEGWVPDNMEAFVKSLPNGAVGKICGAGGGGCMLLFGDLPEISAIRDLAADHQLEIFPVMAQDLGCRGLPE